MYENIYNAEVSGSLRRIHFSLRATADDAPINPTTTGVKANLSLGGAAPAPSTNDIVSVDATNMPGAHYIELTTAELATFVKGELVGSIKDAVGAKVEDIQATIIPYDVFSTAVPDVNLVSAVGQSLTGDGITTPIHA